MIRGKDGGVGVAGTFWLLRGMMALKSLIVVFSLFAIAGGFKYNGCDQPFIIQVWNKDYSLGFNVCYKIDNDSVVVTYYSEGQHGKLLARQAISDSQQDKICNWVSTHNIDSYAERYDSGTQDGDQKLIEFDINGKKKSVQLSNYYLPDMAELFDIINEMDNKDLHIDYSKRKRYGGADIHN